VQFVWGLKDVARALADSSIELATRRIGMCGYTAVPEDGRTCLYLSACICQKNTRPKFTKIFVHVTRGRGSILLRRQCCTLCTSGFVDDVMFSHNRWNEQNQRRHVCFVEFTRWRHGGRSMSSPTPTPKRSGMDHTVLPANTPCPPFLHKRSPDGTTLN